MINEIKKVIDYTSRFMVSCNALTAPLKELMLLKIYFISHLSEKDVNALESSTHSVPIIELDESVNSGYRLFFILKIDKKCMRHIREQRS